MQVNVTTVPAVFTFAPVLTLRVYDTEGNPWFVAVDIERMFGISNIRKRVASLDEDERSAVPAPQGGSPLTVVNESGLWTLVLRSDAALQKGTAAYKARKWVTSEVLPAIRRTGRYETDQSAQISTSEQYEIRKAIKARAKNSSVHYQTVYNALYDYFKIASYKDLRHDQMKAALALIETCTLKPQLSAPAIPEGSIVIDEAMAEKIVVFIYYWRYLFRDDLNLFLALLRRVKSPLAAHFWEAVNDLGLGFMEDALAKQGYSVKDLSCYQHWASQQPKRLTA